MSFLKQRTGNARVTVVRFAQTRNTKGTSFTRQQCSPHSQLEENYSLNTCTQKKSIHGPAFPFTTTITLTTSIGWQSRHKTQDTRLRCRRLAPALARPLFLLFLA
ncbi:unnamed protein product, partial [Ectocarpus sp. 8 AP-2014]